MAGARFELRPGEIHTLVGENGTGKSTLVKVITGVHQPDTGQIFFRGHPVAISSPLAAQRLGIADIYQEATLFPNLDIAENIYMGTTPCIASSLMLTTSTSGPTCSRPYPTSLPTSGFRDG